MKKLVYIIVVLVVLLGLATLLKDNQPETAVVEETVAVATDDGTVAEGEVVVVDQEPAGEVVDVVEENPEDTSGEDETIVEE